MIMCTIYHPTLHSVLYKRPQSLTVIKNHVQPNDNPFLQSMCLLQHSYMTYLNILFKHVYFFIGAYEREIVARLINHFSCKKRKKEFGIFFSIFFY